MDDPAFDVEVDLQIQSILLAAANHDIQSLRNLLRNSSANVQDSESGFTPLHAAIAACEPDLTIDEGKFNGNTNGNTDETVESNQQDIDNAVKTMKLLFENGAVWNEVDANGETPGCIARRLGLKEVYELCVDVGIRAELLNSRMDEYQPLGDTGSDDEDNGRIDNLRINQDLRNDGSTDNFSLVTSTRTVEQDRILDISANSVMVAWETAIMHKSADLLVPGNNLRILNVGHGLGIIDSIFQEKQPISHHIVEAHPDVIVRMKEQGWHEKLNVVIHEGRWQDIMPGLMEKGEMFDIIYFDTFPEEYKALREFFTEYVIGLLDPAGGLDGEGGRFGFFNSIGADRQVVYDVFHKVIDIDLMENGFDAEWETIPVPDVVEQDQRKSARRMNWNPSVLDHYKLPTCRFID